MGFIESLVQEYRNIDSVRFWSAREKAAARSAVRAVAVRAGLYPEFMMSIDVPNQSNVVRLSERAQSQDAADQESNKSAAEAP